jgi:hypothetical protein
MCCHWKISFQTRYQLMGHTTSATIRSILMPRG